MLPDPGAFLVVQVDGGPEPLHRQAEITRQQLVGERNRPFLEVIAEGEIAQHLEEGQVMTVPPHLLDVRGAEDLLGGGRAPVGRLPLAQEVGLEGHHSGAGEEQRGVIERDQGGAGQHLVVPLFEEVEETLADLGAMHGGRTPRALAEL